MGQPESVAARPLVITGCGVMSSIGTGLEDFGAGLAAQRSGRVSLDGLFDGPMPSESACMIPGFKASAFLGKKGTSSFDRITSFVVVTCGLALENSHLTVTDDNRDRIGITIGTSTGSLKSTSDYSRETLVQERPYLVNPMLFPSTILNCPAAQAAIWYSLKGVNATVSGGQLSSLMALRYASMVIRQGYVDVLLVGAVEEFTPHTAWGYQHAGVLDGTDTLVGEGCAVFVVEDPALAAASGRRPLAEILACEMGVYGEPGDPCLPHGLAQCMQRALRRAGVSPEQVWAVAGCSTGERRLDAAEAEALRLVFSEPLPRPITTKPQIGECHSAAGAFQLAAVLSAFRAEPGDPAHVALVTSISHDGAAGCAVVKPWA
jgi:3-oxoacyl-[acyl-carrier-protein] synthase II